MDIKVESGESCVTIEESLQLPFLENATKQPKTKTQKVIRKTFKGTGNLAKLLPTGSVLAFQILSPIITHQGQCNSNVSHYLTLGLLSFCGISCFLLCLTDSFRDERGKVRYGLATWNGLLVIEGGSMALCAEEASKYRLRFLDVLHALMSILVFASVALFDENVVKCLFPLPSEEAKELLVVVPIVIGVVCSLLFILFPTKRHGIGCPLSRN
ncbi:uncharacterized protein LOC110811953 [Carica papaya]|uniref:uncharacterized protein LOC110811953 n=1 Tax=Carica papaya TaxID=3649 RepID=UPI000B8D127C|nr:uncharacterized protein LOC110811953 [Carica papaya]